MRDVLALILSGGGGERLGVLCAERAVSALPFGGKYRVIDFVLSNCCHSGVTRVGVLAQHAPASLNDHIGTGRAWDLDRRSGGVEQAALDGAGCGGLGSGAVEHLLEHPRHTAEEGRVDLLCVVERDKPQQGDERARGAEQPALLAHPDDALDLQRMNGEDERSPAGRPRGETDALEKRNHQQPVEREIDERRADHRDDDGQAEHVEAVADHGGAQRRFRQHHLDEELHIFPPLYESHDEQLVHTVKQLQQDHGWLEENWLELHPLIEQAIQGNSYIWEELEHAMQVFNSLYLDHMVLEERIAYPGAKTQAVKWDAEGMGREMASRRKLRTLSH